MKKALRLGPEGHLSQVASFEASRLSLVLEGASMPLAAEISLDASGDGFDAKAPSWAMVTGVAARGPRGDPVREFVNAVTERLRVVWNRRRPGDEDEQGLLADRRRVTDALTPTTAALLAELQPERLRLARRFAQGLRWPAYVALAADPSGRLAQLASVAPGIFAFALTHGRRGDTTAREAAREFRAEVLRGVSLRRALHPLLEDWAGFGARRGQATLRIRHVRNRPEALYALSHSPADERMRRVREQALLLRRAMPGVAGTLLWLPPPLSFAPEDLPTGGRAMARWFQLMKGTVTCTAWLPERRRDVQASVVRWMSRHAQANRSPHWNGPLVGADELLAYASEEGLVVPRDIAPATLAPRIERAHMRREFLEGGQFQGALLEQLLDDLERRQWMMPFENPAVPDDELFEDQPLPAPIPGFSSPGFKVEPLASTARLRAEGIQMQHCVVSRIPLARAGTRAHFHVEVEERPLTLEVLRGRNGRWTLGECRGIRNSLPTDGELQKIRAWLKQSRPEPSP